MSTLWKFARVPSQDFESNPSLATATLRIRTSAIGTRKEESPFWCETCHLENAAIHEAYPVLLVPFTFSYNGNVERGCDSLISSFIEFMLDQVGTHWCPDTSIMSQNVDDIPLVNIVAKVPSSTKGLKSSAAQLSHREGAISPQARPLIPEKIYYTPTSRDRHPSSQPSNLHRASTCDVLYRSADIDSQCSSDMLSRAKRRLLRRSVASMKSQDIKDIAIERLVGVEYENYDIVTDEHLFDVLELFSTCHSKTANLNVLDVSTCLFPTVCYKHDDSFRYHMASMKSRSRHFIDLTIGRLHRAMDAIRNLRDSYHDDDDDDNNNAGDNRPGFLHRRWIQLTSALKLPEIKRLLRTGLYSPRYVERQLSEVWDNLSNSIARGFEVPF